MTLRDRILELQAQHGSLRAAARAIKIDPGYLYLLKIGQKTNPSDETLSRLGLRREVTYVRAS